MYRGPDGTKCAAGCLIPDDMYNPAWETRPWSELADDGLVPDDHRTLITRLQEVHDGYSPLDWNHMLCVVAKNFNLQYKEPSV